MQVSSVQFSSAAVNTALGLWLVLVHSVLHWYADKLITKCLSVQSQRILHRRAGLFFFLHRAKDELSPSPPLPSL